MAVVFAKRLNLDLPRHLSPQTLYRAFHMRNLSVITNLWLNKQYMMKFSEEFIMTNIFVTARRHLYLDEVVNCNSVCPLPNNNMAMGLLEKAEGTMHTKNTTIITMQVIVSLLCSLLVCKGSFDLIFICGSCSSVLCLWALYKAHTRQEFKVPITVNGMAWMEII